MLRNFNKQEAIDLIFNYASFFCLAASGILINFFIAIYFEPEVLGRFNIVYAVYILLSQLSVGGVHYSMLRHVAICQDQRELPAIIFSGLWVTGLLSIVVAILYSYMITWITDVSLRMEFQHITLAIILFSINKVVLSVFNGLKRMRLFALGQSLRYLLLVFFILYVCLKELPGSYLSYTFLFSESLLLSLSLLSLICLVTYRLRITFYWMKTHLLFGLRSFLVGVFVEVNSRVDVLIMSYFLSNAQVGIYSFAMMFVEGLYQLLVVLRNFMNPRIAQFLHKKAYQELWHLMRGVRQYLYPGMAFLLICTLGAYPLIVHWIVQKPIFMMGWWVVCIAGSGLLLACYFIVFEQILTLGGFPWQQSMYGFCIIMSNLILCLTLTPLLGMIGAALAMSLATFVLAMVYLNIFVVKYLNINLLREHDFNIMRS